MLNATTPSAFLAAFPSALAAPHSPAPTSLCNPDDSHSRSLRQLGLALAHARDPFAPFFAKAPTDTPHPSVSLKPVYTPTPGRPSSRPPLQPTIPVPSQLAQLHLDPSPIHPQFFHTALADGIVLLE